MRRGVSWVVVMHLDCAWSGEGWPDREPDWAGTESNPWTCNYLLSP